VEDELPGVQYVVVSDEGVIFEAALGVRDVLSGKPMQRDTLQMAYSMTKAITAVAAMRLVQERKLELDRPLSEYYPAHPYGEGVTIRSLLAQTSGVPNPMPLDWFSPEGESFDRKATLKALLSENAELEHEPGTAYAYSNISYFLLEAAIERASGLDYAEYVERHVFGPLSVAPNNVRFTLGEPERSATGHSRRYTFMNLFAHVMAPSEYWADPHGPWSRAARLMPHGRGYGGMFTNAATLASLLSDLLRDEPRVLRRAVRDQMFTQQKTNDGEAIHMTLGWVVGEVAGERYYGKQGGGLGFHGNLRVYPDRKLATVLLANRTELSASPIDARSDELDAIFLAAGAAPSASVTTRRTGSERASP
jgi:CubicO group peptidase (beta-lactamase class C family)